MQVYDIAWAMANFCLPSYLIYFYACSMVAVETKSWTAVPTKILLSLMVQKPITFWAQSEHGGSGDIEMWNQFVMFWLEKKGGGNGYCHKFILGVEMIGHLDLEM